jgi:hypothetical protein
MDHKYQLTYFDLVPRATQLGAANRIFTGVKATILYFTEVVFYGG